MAVNWWERQTHNFDWEQTSGNKVKKEVPFHICKCHIKNNHILMYSFFTYSLLAVLSTWLFCYDQELLPFWI